MLTFLLLLAAVNISLGVAVALLYDRYIGDTSPFCPDGVTVCAEPSGAMVAAPMIEPAAVHLEPGELPAAWKPVLESIGMDDAPLREAALWVLLQRSEDVRGPLLSMECAWKASEGTDEVSPATREGLSLLTRELRESASLVAATPEIDTSLPPLGEQLLDHASHIEATVRMLTGDESRDARWGSERPCEILRRLLELIFRLRDDLLDRLAQELASQGRVSEIPAALRVDPQVALYNRLGLEYLAQLYQEESDGDLRDVSLALIDIDRFERINQQFGVMHAEALLTAFAQTLEENLRHNRGFDRVTRVSGQAFAFFLGNTPLEGAEHVCERLRQSIEAVSFVLGEREVELTVSCAVGQIKEGESISSILRRLRPALAEARKAGRNRTCIDNGESLVVVQPTQLQVTGRVVEVPIT